jgi:aminopeptidase N
MLRLHRIVILTVGILFIGLGVAGSLGGFGEVAAADAAADAAAKPVPPGPALIGDGAKECSAAKTALAMAPHPPQLSSASTNIDIHYYHLALNLPMTVNTLSGTVRIEGTVVGSTMSTLVLDLQNTMTVTAVKLSDGTPCTFTHSGAVLNITLPSPVAPGGNVKVDVTYNGTPATGGFGYYVFGTRAGKNFVWSLSEPYGAREWWPCKDHPSDKADSVRVTVTCPSQYRCGSQGLLVSETTNGANTTYDWVSHYPISNYLVSIAVSDYTRATYSYVRPAPVSTQYGPLTMLVDNLMYNDGSSTLPFGWGQAGDMISVFEDWFGPYPFANEKYGHSECTFGGGMEHQTMTSLNGSSISLVSHELGHQWFGDSVTNKQWKHIWLHEGFATYAALLYFQQRAPSYPGMYESQLANTYADARNALGTIVLQDTTSVSDMFAQSRIYSKGSMVLYMMRWIVGDTAFRNILKSYIADPALKYNVATTSDFKRVVESVTGTDWGTFFSQWLEDGTGYPVYTACSLWLSDPNGWRVQVTLHQIQDASVSNVNVFVMPVPIVIHTSGGDVNELVTNNERDQTFTFFVPNQPSSVEVDPGKHVLRADPIGSGACAPVGTGTGSLPIRTDIVSVFPNPATGQFAVHYTMGEEGKLDLSVYDVAGRRVLSRTVSRSTGGDGAEFFNASKLPAGVYFVRLTASHGVMVTRKFVVVR